MSTRSSRRSGWLAGFASVALGLAGCLVAIPACNRPAPTTEPPAPARQEEEEEYHGPPMFEDVTPGGGVVFTYRNGEEAGHFAIIESLGGGVALLDYDHDGLLDIFIPGGGYF